MVGSWLVVAAKWDVLPGSGLAAKQRLIGTVKGKMFSEHPVNLWHKMWPALPYSSQKWFGILPIDKNKETDIGRYTLLRLPKQCLEGCLQWRVTKSSPPTVQFRVCKNPSLLTILMELSAALPFTIISLALSFPVVPWISLVLAYLRQTFASTNIHISPDFPSSPTISPWAWA